MRKSVLFIARFDNILKGMNTLLAKSFNMQMCPPEPAMVNKTLDVMEVDLVLFYISGLSHLLLTSLCEKLQEVCLQTPVIVFGTEEECKNFDSYCSIAVSKYMHRPIAALDITRAILELLEGVPAPQPQDQTPPQDQAQTQPQPQTQPQTPPQPQPQTRPETSMSLADFAKALDNDNRRCILLVDDDGRILRAIKMLLEKHYRINLANSGMSALESIERERPDAVLLDYEMPVFDGRRTLEVIRQNKKTEDLPVFFLTGVSDSERIRDVIHLNPQGYLLKSSEQSAILEMLENFFNSTGQ